MKTLTAFQFLYYFQATFTKPDVGHMSLSERNQNHQGVFSSALPRTQRNPILTLQYSIFMNIIIARLCYSVFTFSFFSLLLKYTYLIYFAYGGNTWYRIVHITPQKYVTFYKERSATMDLTRQQFDFSVGMYMHFTPLK